MRKRLLLLSVILWPLALLAGEDAAPPPAEQLVITLRAEAISNGEQVLLGEIATVSGVSAELQARLAALSLGRAAPPGQVCSFNTGDITMALHRAGFAQPPELKGPREIKVTATAQTLTGQALAEAARAAVQKLFAQDTDLEVELDVATTPADLTLRLGEAKLDPEVAGDKIRPGLQTIQVHISQNGRHIADTMVSLRLRLTGTVQVATEHLATGDVLTGGLIKKVRKELNFNDLQNRCDASKLVNLRAKSGIAAGQMLSRDLFSLPFLIRRGDEVSVSVHSSGGLLEIATMGEARGDAAADESVRLLLDNGKEVIARATGAREACVDEPHHSRL